MDTVLSIGVDTVFQAVLNRLRLRPE